MKSCAPNVYLLECIDITCARSLETNYYWSAVYVSNDLSFQLSFMCWIFRLCCQNGVVIFARTETPRISKECYVSLGPCVPPPLHNPATHASTADPTKRKTPIELFVQRILKHGLVQPTSSEVCPTACEMLSLIYFSFDAFHSNPSYQRGAVNGERFSLVRSPFQCTPLSSRQPLAES